MKVGFIAKKFVVVVVALFMGLPLSLTSQNIRKCFEDAYSACPQIPRGMLEAVSFTNTHFTHLTDADYHNCGEDHDMPRAYGLMGLVADGKGVFRENLHLVSQLSGFTESEILADPGANVMAYAVAFVSVMNEKQCRSLSDFQEVLKDLSELPLEKESDEFPMDVMLYSVYYFMGNEALCQQFGIEKTDIDMKAVFGDKLDYLQSGSVVSLRDVDYPGAVWNPAASCNYGTRTDPVTAVVVHDTEGSFAGSVSWFQNCQAGTSAHYVVRSVDGYVVQMVREADKAWHARDANRYAIGIEHEGYASNPAYYTDTMYKSSAALVKNICDRYDAIGSHYVFYRDTLDNGTALDSGLHELGGDNPETNKVYCTRVCGHQHLYNQTHTDPGPYWNWDYYYRLINRDVTEPEILEGTSGVFNNHTSKNYPNSERSLTLIRVPEGSIVNLEFQSFALETNYDFMWIYDGNSEFAPLIGRYNTQSPGVVQSSGNEMLVEFRSDCNDNAAGWHATWSAIATTTEIFETACDSFEWNNITYNQSGDYEYITQSASGGDSTVVLHLTINQSVHNEIIVISYESYMWNGVTYTESGDYDQTFTTAQGCDSIVTMHLTLNLLPNITVTGDTLIYEGQNATLTASGAVSYQWSNGNTTPTIVVSPPTTTTYYVQGFDENGASVGYGSITVTVLPDGIKELENQHVVLFPNPVLQSLKIELPYGSHAQASIVDVCGREVASVAEFDTFTNVDVSKLKAGVYFVKCFVNNSTLKMAKFVKM